jgi:diadenosine tetraphosphatase ApaH/serine/threonine PP2A family protein phosphatase
MNDGDMLQIMLVHGSPRKINEYLFEDREEKSLMRILEGANADILCFGHTHKPYHRILTSGTPTEPHFRHAINIGSVGKPKDGDPRGGYVLLHLDKASSLSAAESIRVEFVRFEYDVEKAARAVEESPLPAVYATALWVAQ